MTALLSLTLHRVALAAALAATITGALAQGASAPASPAKRELVQRVLQAQKVGLERVGAELAAQTAAQTMRVAVAELQRVPAAKREAVGKELQTEVRKFHDDISPLLRERAWKLAPEAYGVTLAEQLTEDELKQLLAWLESPLSLKFQQLTGQVYPQMMQRLVADTRGSVEPKIRALEARLKAVVGGAGGAPAAAASGPRK